MTTYIRYHCGGNVEAGRTDEARTAATWREQGWHVERQAQPAERWFARFDGHGVAFQVTPVVAEARSWRRAGYRVEASGRRGIKAAFLAMVLAFASGSAAAGPPNPMEDGAGFVEKCGTAPDGSVWSERCASYIAGLSDAVADFRLLGMLPPCPQATEASYGEQKRRAIAYIRRFPARQQDEMLFILIAANDEATGCSTGGAFGPKTSKF